MDRKSFLSLITPVIIYFKFAVRRDGKIGSEAGFIFPFAIMAMMVLFTLALAVFTLSTGSMRGAKAWDERNAALYAAESGINEAIYRLMGAGQQPEEVDWPLEMNLDDRTSYSVVFEGSGSERFVVSTGISGNVQRAVRLMLEFTSTLISIFPPDVPPPSPIIATTAEPDSVHYYEGYVDPDVSLPGWEPQGVERPPLTSSTTLGPGTYWYESIDLRNNRSLTINGPATIYVTEDFNLNNNVSFNISNGVTIYVSGNFNTDTNCDLDFQGDNDIYVGGNLTFENNVTIEMDDQGGQTQYIVGGNLSIGNNDEFNTGNDASQLLIYLTTDTNHNVTLSNNADVTSGIYAPTAAVIIDNNVNLVGAIVGNTVDVGNNVTAAYDNSLADVTVPGGEGGAGGGAGTGEWGIVSGTWATQ